MNRSTDSSKSVHKPKEYFHCSKCKNVFKHLNSLRFHQKTCKGKRLGCSDQSHVHSLMEQEFATFEEAKQWIYSMELDQTFQIARTRSNCTWYQCRRNKAQKPQEQSETSVRKRKSSGTGYVPCSAQFTISVAHICRCMGNEAELGQICSDHHVVRLVKGCAKHSHEVDIKHQRISKSTKDSLINLLRAGVPKSIIMERYCSPENYDRLDRKLITMHDLRNLERKFASKGVDLTKPDFVNACEILEGEGFRGFSFADIEGEKIPESIADKAIEGCKMNLFVYASEFMLEQFRQQPGTLFVDGTHGTNRSEYSLITLLVADSRGEGMPIMQVVAKSECKDAIVPALRILARLAPESVDKVKVLLSDMAHSFINAWREVFPSSEAQHVVCAWHLLNAWKRELLPHHADFYKGLCRLRTVTDPHEFWIQYYKLRHDY